MSAQELEPKVLSRTRPRKARKPLPIASVRIPPADLKMIDTAASVLSEKEGRELTRSDVIYSGTMQFVRAILGNAA